LCDRRLYPHCAGQWYVSFSSRACDLFAQTGNPLFTYQLTLGVGISTLMVASVLSVLLMF
jgi:hypothetical protein